MPEPPGEARTARDATPHDTDNTAGVVRSIIGKSLSGLDWECEEFEGDRYERCVFHDLRAMELSSARCVFAECEFHGAVLGSSVHTESAFINCTFRRTSLFGAAFRECKMTGSAFHQCDLRPLAVTGGDWSLVAFRGADLRGVDFGGARLAGTDFTDADLSNAVLAGSDLSRAVLSGSTLRGCDLRGITVDGIAWADVDIAGSRISIDLAVAFAAGHGAVVE